MRVVLVTSTVPFVIGGAERLVTWLEQALVERGHEVEVFRLPVHSTAAGLPRQLLAMRSLDLTGHGDRLVTVRTPSHVVRHHSKVAWFLHHHRPAYDLWDRYRDVPDDGSGREFRRLMHASDEVALAECERVFCNSQRVADRLRRYNDVEAEVLYPPLGPHAGSDPAAAPGPGGRRDTLVYVSRVEPHKRQLLAVRAMAHVRTPVRLWLAGTSNGHDYDRRVSTAIDELGLADRVTFLNAAVRDATRDAMLARSLGVVYLPEDEDSYGFVGLESAAHSRPLVTTTDSGGVLELVADGVNGLVAEPDPRSVAAAFDALYLDQERADAMGRAHAPVLERLRVSWDHVVERLTA